MADSDEKTDLRLDLTAAEKEEILAALKALGAPKVCDLCGVTKWSIGDHLVTPVLVSRSDAGWDYHVADLLHSSALLMCRNCGNTKFVNVGLLGAPQVPPSVWAKK